MFRIFHSFCIFYNIFILFMVILSHCDLMMRLYLIKFKTVRFSLTAMIDLDKNKNKKRDDRGVMVTVVGK